MTSELCFVWQVVFNAQQTFPKFYDSAGWGQVDSLVLVKVTHASPSAAALVEWKYISDIIRSRSQHLLLLSLIMFSNEKINFCFFASVQLSLEGKALCTFSIASPILNILTITLEMMDLQCYKYPNKLCNLWLHWDIIDHIYYLFVSPQSLTHCLVDWNSQ